MDPRECPPPNPGVRSDAIAPAAAVAYYYIIVLVSISINIIIISSSSIILLLEMAASKRIAASGAKPQSRGVILRRRARVMSRVLHGIAHCMDGEGRVQTKQHKCCLSSKDLQTYKHIQTINITNHTNNQHYKQSTHTNNQHYEQSTHTNVQHANNTNPRTPPRRGNEPRGEVYYHCHYFQPRCHCRHGRPLSGGATRLALHANKIRSHTII